jgi:hypothetical protein
VIDAVRLTYAALTEVPAPKHHELRVRTVDGITDRIHLGLDDDGRHHLLVESPDAPKTGSGVAAITTLHRDLRIGSDARRYLDVTCHQRDLAEVFDHFVAGVIERTRDDDADLGLVVTEVLDRWRSFFTATGAPPSRETVTGVIGELLVLRDVATVDPGAVIATWVGPRGGRHDFRRGNTAVEVKTTRSHTSRTISIHGEDQLLEPEGATLHLHFVRLEEVAGLGVSILELVDELTSAGVPRLELLEVLADAGIPPAALAAVGEVRFDVRERLTFLVDDGMPRIIPATFAAGARPPGVLDIVYRVDLDHVAHRALDPTAYQALLMDLASSSTQ